MPPTSMEQDDQGPPSGKYCGENVLYIHVHFPLKELAGL